MKNTITTSNGRAFSSYLAILVCSLLLLTTISACTRHLVSTASSPAQPASAASTPAAVPVQAEPLRTPVSDTIISGSLTDSLIGTWKIQRVEADKAMEKLTTYGSQADRDEMQKKQKEYQQAFVGLITQLKRDMTFESLFGGSTDLGIWAINDQRNIQTISKIKGTPSVFNVRSVTAKVLTVTYEANGVVLLLTFERQ